MLKKQIIFLLAMFFLAAYIFANENSEFWNWFEKNESQYFEFSFDETKQRDRLFSELGKKLKKIDENLTFEIGRLSDSKRDLVISAGGIESSFPRVIELVKTAPNFERWKVTAFRQAKESIAAIEMGGVEMNGENTVVQLYKDREKIGVVLYLPGYKKTPNQVYEQIGFLLLDQTLGEYTVGTKVGFVEFEAYKKGVENAFKLKDIPVFFEN